jgi:hypothetical protein
MPEPEGGACEISEVLSVTADDEVDASEVRSVLVVMTDAESHPFGRTTSAQKFIPCLSPLTIANNDDAGVAAIQNRRMMGRISMGMTVTVRAVERGGCCII